MQNTTFRGSLKQSIESFEKYIRPVLKEKFKTNQFVSVEANNIDELAKLLDTLAGIDLWTYNSTGMRGVASRVQFGTAWNTFTIRKHRDTGTKTEYEKRKHAIENNYLYPYYTIQGYVDRKKDKLLSFALAKTEDIMKMIELNECWTNHTGEGEIGQASFYVVRWQAMEDSGANIFIHQ